LTGDQSPVKRKGIAAMKGIEKVCAVEGRKC